ncbi:MlaC/ttg2D family ABC transporter substrate-binding protein [Halocynthiibacter namhaensis]|uniref:MlaC/ttg2D family ABC transporter substrate-binding protein n=1 Tax=Halocynthiibacter namhaensis TaxID=1290553 RepID=UPI0012E072F9|nr:ABC transporter substrate-binding protein [Halocynthiibacter namhaensis]
MVNSSSISRRGFTTGLLATTSVVALAPTGAMALTAQQASSLVAEVVAEITSIINSGQSESRMLNRFERVFKRYANTTVIAFRCLGADARRASNSQKRAFVQAFEGYIARKYGRRFREFIGGRIDVQNVRQVKSWFEVNARTQLQGSAPFSVDFLVKEGGGRNLFFDMLIEGISLTRVEREEIGAMLDSRGGDLDRLISDLRSAG